MRGVTRKRGGANKNSNNNNKNNNKNNNNKNEEYENQELIEHLAEGDVEWFREQLDTNAISINQAFVYTFLENDTVVEYEGTLIGFLAAMATREFHTGAVPKQTITTLVDFFLENGANPDKDYFVDATESYYQRDIMFSPISLFIVGSYNTLAKKVAKAIAKRRVWTPVDTKLTMDELDAFNLFNVENEESVTDKWKRFFQTLETSAEKEHQKAIAPVLKNIQNIPRQQAQKEETIGKKQELLLEFGHLEPIPELSGFEGGPNWRKHIEYLRKMNRHEAVNMEEFQKHLNYPLYNYSRAQKYLYPSRKNKTRRRNT